ncbi:IS1 family transposase [Escherichia coli]
MTDGWPLYESRLKGKLHVISKRYTQRIERHNLNLRQHWHGWDGSRCRSQKSVELHDKNHRALSEHKNTINKLESLPGSSNVDPITIRGQRSGWSLASPI